MSLFEVRRIQGPNVHFLSAPHLANNHESAQSCGANQSANFSSKTFNFEASGKHHEEIS